MPNVSDSIKVSVVCLTYNHHQYIRDALEGFVQQRTNFRFEVLVHDDASSDGTTDIVRDYANRYPDIIRPIFQRENQWSKGLKLSKTFIYPLIRGEYVALCEGDDYWTDPLKLQKQVDALNARPDAAVCFHPVIEHWENHSKPDSVFPSQKFRFMKDELTLEDLLKRNFIPTNSVMYRWRFHEDSLDLIPDGILPTDWFLHLLHAQKGKILFLEDCMSIYRRHGGGVWFGAAKIEKNWFRKFAMLQVRFFDAMEKTFKVDRFKEKRDLIVQSYTFATIEKDTEWLKQLQQMWPFEPKELNFTNWTYVRLCFLYLFSWGERKKSIYAQLRLVQKCLRIRRAYKNNS